MGPNDMNIKPSGCCCRVGSPRLLWTHFCNGVPAVLCIVLGQLLVHRIPNAPLTEEAACSSLVLSLLLPVPIMPKLPMLKRLLAPGRRSKAQTNWGLARRRDCTWKTMMAWPSGECDLWARNRLNLEEVLLMQLETDMNCDRNSQSYLQVKINCRILKER